MHLSYRGAAYLHPSESLVALKSDYFSTSSLRRGPVGGALLRQVVSLVAFTSSRTASALRSVASQTLTPSLPTMTFSKSYGASLSSSGYSGELSERGQSERYDIERRLQLAYAVGNRQEIRSLEADLEAVTGWRFNRQRAWLEQ